jgi:hypothetical protein
MYYFILDFKFFFVIYSVYDFSFVKIFLFGFFYIFFLIIKNQITTFFINL